MKVGLIFGVSGQDGAYLAQLLLGKGYRVIGSSRDAQVSSFSSLAALGIKERVECVSASLHDFRSVLQLLKRYRPDEIYNLAGQSSVGLSFDQPVETFESISIANLNLLEAIRFLEVPTRYYNASSGECFGNTDGKAVSESDSFQPRSPYAVAKSAAFWQVANYREAYQLFACSGILFNHESCLRPARFVTQKIVQTATRIAAGSKEKLFLGNMAVERDWGWAPEYVQAMWLMLQQEKPDDFIIATGKTYSLADFVQTVFARLGLEWRQHVEVDPSLLRPTDIMTIRTNPSKAARVLGWKARYDMLDVARLMLAREL